MTERRHANDEAKLSHHSLHAWHQAVDLVKLVAMSRIGDRELRDQATRASRSAALNAAEGAAYDGALARRHFRIARASAIETIACYELAEAIGEHVALAPIRRTGARLVAMLSGLVPRRGAAP